MPYKLVSPKAGRWAHWRVRGTENGLYVDRSTKTGDRKAAERILKEWRAEAQKGSLGTKREPSFASAAIAYMEAGGERRFLAPLLRTFGEMPLSMISQARVDAASAALYPDSSPATRNRQVYSPISAILKRAGLPAAFRRPKGAQGKPRIAWLKPEEAMRLLDAAEAVDAHFGALCTFLLYTGVRLSEALRLEWKDVDLQNATAHIGRTKNGSPITIHLNPDVVERMGNLPRERARAFRITKSGRLYNLLGRASDRAGLSLPDRSAFHILRHTHATWRRLYTGADTSALVATGLWKSRAAAAVYEHVDVTEESRKADLLPTRARIVRSEEKP